MAVPKEHIVSEIRRLAVENGGRPPGTQAFKRETGMTENAWRGRYWVNWGQALTEAGYTPNSWCQPIPEEDLLKRLAMHIRELGRYPVNSELSIRRLNDPELPTVKVFSNRFGSVQATADALLRYARKENDAELVAICEARVSREEPKPAKVRNEGVATGSVYLMKSGQFYKIGMSNASGRREYELGIQLPERLKLIHEIKTDCPAALENYWHNRFAAKRKNGEWFELDGAEIKSFAKRKRFMFGEAFP
jgi:hypothetical protein